MRAAFAKLDGVVAKDVKKDIVIKKGDKPGTQKVMFKSTAGDLTKKKAIASLGTKASRYVVKDFKKG